MANKKLLNIRVIFLLVISTGFEPVNAAVKGQCVKQLHQLANGASSRTRTYDPLINSQVL